MLMRPSGSDLPDGAVFFVFSVFKNSLRSALLELNFAGTRCILITSNSNSGET